MGEAERKKTISWKDNLAYDELRNRPKIRMLYTIYNLIMILVFLNAIVTRIDTSSRYEFNEAFFNVIKDAFNPNTYKTYSLKDINSISSAIDYIEALVSYFYNSDPSADYYFPSIPSKFHLYNESHFLNLKIKNSFNIIQGVNVTAWANNTFLDNYVLGNEANDMLNLNYFSHLLKNWTSYYIQNQSDEYLVELDIFIENINLGLFNVYQIMFEASPEFGFNIKISIEMFNSEHYIGMNSGDETFFENLSFVIFGIYCFNFIYEFYIFFDEPIHHRSVAS